MNLMRKIVIFSAKTLTLRNKTSVQLISRFDSLSLAAVNDDFDSKHTQNMQTLMRIAVEPILIRLHSFDLTRTRLSLRYVCV